MLVISRESRKLRKNDYCSLCKILSFDELVSVKPNQLIATNRDDSTILPPAGEVFSKKKMKSSIGVLHVFF